jgi:hypothetical protein
MAKMKYPKKKNYVQYGPWDYVENIDKYKHVPAQEKQRKKQAAIERDRAIIDEYIKNGGYVKKIAPKYCQDCDNTLQECTCNENVDQRAKGYWIKSNGKNENYRGIKK